MVQSWTVSSLKPSSDAIPYPVHGVLWEATATDTAIAGPVTPIVSNFNARARNGDTYRVLFGVATPQGVNPATLPQGAHSTGKLYFDVTGAEPDSVLYNAGGADLLLWLTPPPAPQGVDGPRATRTPGASTGTGATAAPAEAAPNGTVPAQPAGVGGTAGGDVPTGSSGTPLPAGTGAPTGSSGTPVGAPGATTGSVPPAGGSQGTPVGPGASPSAPPPSAAGQPTPSLAPAGSQGTPATAAPSTTPITPPPA